MAFASRDFRHRAVPFLWATLLLGVVASAAPAQTSCAPPIARDDQWQVNAPESVGLDGARLCALKERFRQWPEASVVDIAR
jgi:hypothetical protein